MDLKLIHLSHSRTSSTEIELLRGGAEVEDRRGVDGRRGKGRIGAERNRAAARIAEQPSGAEERRGAPSSAEQPSGRQWDQHHSHREDQSVSPPLCYGGAPTERHRPRSGTVLKKR